MKIYKYSLILGIMSSCLLSLTACSSEDHENTLANWKWDTGEDEEEPVVDADANPAVIAQGWSNVTAEYGELPEYLNIYKTDKTTAGDAAVAYIAVADMSQAKFGVTNDIHWSEVAGGNGNESIYTLSEFYTNNNGPLVLINGGLFFYSPAGDGSDFYYSQSACYSEGVLLSPNQNYWSENWVDFWYPTLGFFYQDATGEFHTTWTYYHWTGNDYAYADCKKIDLSTPETEAPDANNPSAATVMNDGTAVNGIGGVSVLIHEGIIRDTWADELLDVSADTNQPRTAIAYDAGNKRLVFFVCEGRQMTEGVAGMTTAEVANMLKAIGCTEALNLDGGGSSCMLVNGKETIKPSDGSQRKVIDACYIR